MSKMGISTIASYRCSQLFEAVGLHTDVVDLSLPWQLLASKALALATSNKISIIYPVRLGLNVNHWNMVAYSNTYMAANTMPTADVVGTLQTAVKTGETSDYLSLPSNEYSPCSDAARLNEPQKSRSTSATRTSRAK